MIGARSRSLILQLAAVMFVAAPGISLGKPPARIDNVWHWRHHEPAPAQIRRAERVKPILPVPGPRPATTAEVEDLYQFLMGAQRIPGR